MDKPRLVKEEVSASNQQLSFIIFLGRTPKWVAEILSMHPCDTANAICQGESAALTPAKTRLESKASILRQDIQRGRVGADAIQYALPVGTLGEPRSAGLRPCISPLSYANLGSRPRADSRCAGRPNCFADRRACENDGERLARIISDVWDKGIGKLDRRKAALHGCGF